MTILAGILGLAMLADPAPSPYGESLRWLDSHTPAPMQGPSEDYSGPVPGEPGVTVTGKGQIYLSADFSLLPLDSAVDALVDTCINACQGPPPLHKTHSECNRLCDAPCKKTHKYTVEDPVQNLSMYYQPLFEGIGRLEALASKRGFQFDKSGGEFFDSLMSMSESFGREAAAEPLELNLAHLGSGDYKPCTCETRIYKSKRYRLVVDIVLVYVLAGKRVDGTQFSKPTELGREEITLGTVGVFSTSPEVNSALNCLCGEVREPEDVVPEGHSMIPSPGTWKGGLVSWAPTQSGIPSYGQLDNRLGVRNAPPIEIIGMDMNRVTVNMPEMMTGCWLPAGTVLVPDDPTVQEMMVVVGGWATNTHETSLLDLQTGPQTFRVMCLEMGKKEPTSKTKFRAVPPADDGLTRLAKIAESADRRGPWDQARIWMYTDFASQSDLRDRLVPTPDMAQYRDNFMDVVSGAAKRKVLEPLLKNLESAMLTIPGGSEEALCYTTGLLMQKDPKGVARTIGRPSEAFVRDPKAASTWVKRMTNNLIGSGAKEASDALENLLLGCVPKTMRDPLKQSNALDPVKLWKLSARKERREAAEKILKEYGL